ncbi:hypothetical protein [Brochothrix thermosphacta]|uniref:hypothetical protein n=1 Tax=Brochothrix thermosphacta TaxID=2756 RepID=UPI003F94A30D
MIELNGFHGTDKEKSSVYEKTGFSLKRYTLGQEVANAQRNKHSKSPGSFGYGFYMFLDDREMATLFSKKFHKEENVVIYELKLKIDEQNLLDLRDNEERKRYNAFFKSIEKRIEEQMERMKKTSNHQSLPDGIALEVYCTYLKTKEKIIVKSIMGESYTTDTKIRSFVNNCTEVCIRDGEIVSRFERCD